ncbi:hypothetical protein [Thomasclavelia spiroformis]|uniref:hypothetical protein n=1 Tax=Thomasclavelia spiroformis TaxID=29348 RepID=UPI00255BDDAF|nr:hypothetical protein [Thomasclavelia spiroformis]
MKRKVMKEKGKEMTVSILIDLIASMLPGPTSIIFSNIGKTILMPESNDSDDLKNSNVELKKQIENLNQEQIETVKQQLIKLYQSECVLKDDLAYCEIFEVNVIEIFTGVIMSFEEQDVLSSIICEYINNGLEYTNNYFNEMIDTYYLRDDNIIINLLDFLSKEEADELVFDLKQIIYNELNYTISKIYFY